MNQQSPDNRHHPAAQHNHRDIVLSSPGIELLEMRIQLDVLHQQLYTLIIRRLDTVHHSLEGVAERHLVVQDVLVALLSQLLSVSDVVCEEVIGVAGGDCAVEVGEEDEFGVGFHCGESRGGHVDD